MRSLLGRFHRPMSRGAMGDMLTMNSLGDGSTLSLDFTTMGSVLDPRLTFSRASTATFVNSSGYVQFANANCFTFSNPRQTGTAWSATGTVTWNGTGGIADPIGGTNAQSITFGTAASAIFNTAGTTVVSGITHTFSVWLRAASGTTNARIGDANVGAVSTVTLTTTWQRFSCQYVSSGTNDGGAIYSQTVTASAEMYVWGAQVQPGSIAGDLIQTNGTQNYSTPRFDYNPTTIGEPRGLLIEGQAVNYMLQSTSLTGYSVADMATPIAGSESNPDGIANTALQIYATAGAVTYHGFYRTLAAGTNTTITVSIWAKARNYTHLFISDLVSQRSAVRFNLSTGVTDNNVGAGYVSAKTTAFPNGWWRCEMVVNVTASTAYGWAFAGVPSGATLNGFGAQYAGTGNAADGIYCYGFQVEGGSGASSYIPTGASGVTRNADQVVLSNLSGISFSQSAGTMYSQVEFVEKLRGSFIPYGSFDTTGGGRGWWWLRHNHDTSVGQRILGSAYNSVGGNAINSGNYTHSNGVFKFATSLDPTAGRMVYAISGGSAQITTATGFTLATAAQMSINKNNDVLVTETGSMWFRTLKYWPTALPDAQLTSITS